MGSNLRDFRSPYANYEKIFLKQSKIVRIMLEQIFLYRFDPDSWICVT